MNQEELKEAAAIAALDYVEENSIVGVGTGTTVHYFIQALAKIKDKIQGALASSKATETLLKSHGIPIFELNNLDSIPVYIDGADACNPHRQLIKGRGGALTREKILAAAAECFICIIDESKKMNVLGNVPVPIEVIPMARSFVAREIVKLGGQPIYRENCTTDNGNIILDVHHWIIAEPIKLERALDSIPGVVCNGIFAERSADLVLISNNKGMTVLGSLGGL